MTALLVAFMSVLAWGEEGFDPRPPADPGLRRAWDATFMLYVKDGGDFSVASAVVIDQRDEFTYLLTADHALARGCDERRCPRLRVYENPAFAWRNARAIKLRPLSGSPEVVSRDQTQDLALVRIRSTFPAAAVALGRTCANDYSRVFAIGFPVTSDRQSPVDIPEPGIVRRRRSEGRLFGRAVVRDDGRLFFGRDEAARPVLVTSADALPGSSGGALVNELGQLVGLVTRWGGRAESGWNYVGRGKAVSSQINAIVTPCEVIHAFLERAALESTGVTRP